MHELSIASSIVDIANEYVEKNGGGNILEIEIEIGRLSGVVLDALKFASEVAFENTVLANAKSILIEIPAIAKCDDCQNIFEVDDHYSPCPQCQSFRSTLIEGQELKVKSILID